MTTTSSNSLFGLDDMEALLWGPSCPTADPLGSPLLHPDTPEDGGETFAEGAGGASPLSLLSPLSSSPPSSSSSPPPLYSPPPALLRRDKTDNEEEEEEEEEEEGLLALPWLGHAGVRPYCGKVDAFSGLDWMSERMDLREFDLDSLIGSCSPCDESPVSPDDLLSSLDCPMDLDDLSLPSLPTPTLPLPPPLPPAPLPSPPASAPSSPASHGDRQEVPLSPMFVPDPQEELEIKSEPVSPPPPPSYTLDLGSEVDVTECEVKPAVRTAPAAVPRVPRIVLSLATTRIVVLLAPKAEEKAANRPLAAPPVIRAAPPGSAATRTPRSRPYPEPKFRPVPATTSTTTTTSTSRTTAGQSTTSPKTQSSSSGGDAGGGGRGAAAAAAAAGGGGGRAKGAQRPPKEKKLKKMEQNKTAATRYRQKKRAEHDHLHTEYTALENRNGELKETADSLAREIQYLKELMEEVRVAKLGNGSGC